MSTKALRSETSITPSSSSGRQSSGFDDIDRLTDTHGLVAVISRRRSNGIMTFAIFKTFERDGRTEQTNFIPEPLFDAYDALVKLVRERIAHLRAESPDLGVRA